MINFYDISFIFKCLGNEMCFCRGFPCDKQCCYICLRISAIHINCIIISWNAFLWKSYFSFQIHNRMMNTKNHPFKKAILFEMNKKAISKPIKLQCLWEIITSSLFKEEGQQLFRVFYQFFLLLEIPFYGHVIYSYILKKLLKNVLILYQLFID